jgi:hypothetical protein
VSAAELEGGLFRRMISSVWLAASVGVLFGLSLTGSVFILDKNFGATSGHGNFTMLLMFLITGPEGLLYSIGDFNRSAEYQHFLERWGHTPTFAINALLGAVLFSATALCLKLLFTKEIIGKE